MAQRYLIIAALLLVSAGPVIGDEPPAVAEPSAARAASSDDLAGWIRDLDSSDFEVRRLATRRLVQAGAAAIDPIVKAAQAGSLEVKVRAVGVLQEIYTNGDDSVIDAAETALESLAASESRSAAGRADAVLVQNSDLRERRALEAIERLGGTIEYVDNARAFNPNLPEGARRTIQFIRLGTSWKGGDDGLKHLKRLEHMQVLQVYIIDGSGVSEEGLKDLQGSLPNVMLQQRGRSFLGVRGGTDANGTGCQIVTVEENSAAEKAGLQSGDVITHFNGKRCETFEALIGLIGDTKPGDKVPVKITRNLEPLAVEVEMAGWSK